MSWHYLGGPIPQGETGELNDTNKTGIKGENVI